MWLVLMTKFRTLYKILCRREISSNVMWNSVYTKCIPVSIQCYIPAKWQKCVRRISNSGLVRRLYLMVVQPGCVSRGRRVTGVRGTSTTSLPAPATVAAAAVVVLSPTKWDCVAGRRGGPRRWTTRRGLHGSESGGDGGRKTPDDVLEVATSRCAGCDMTACDAELYSCTHHTQPSSSCFLSSKSVLNAFALVRIDAVQQCCYRHVDNQLKSQSNTKDVLRNMKQRSLHFTNNIVRQEPKHVGHVLRRSSASKALLLLKGNVKK